MDIVKFSEQTKELTQLRDYTELRSLPDGIGVTDSETIHDYTQLMIAEKIVDLQMKEMITKTIIEPIKLNLDDIYFTVANMSKNDQITLFSSMLEDNPEFRWFRGGGLHTASDDWKTHIHSQDFIPDDNNLVVLDAPFGMLGYPDVTRFALKGDNGIRQWPVMYVVSLKDIVQGLQTNAILLRTGHGNDLTINYPATIFSNGSSEKYYNWMANSVNCYDMASVKNDKISIETKAGYASNILLGKCEVQNDWENRIQKINKLLKN